MEPALPDRIPTPGFLNRRAPPWVDQPPPLLSRVERRCFSPECGRHAVSSCPACGKQPPLRRRTCKQGVSLLRGELHGGSVSTSQVRTDGVVEVERGLQIVDGKEPLNERKATANRYLIKEEHGTKSTRRCSPRRSNLREKALALPHENHQEK